MGTRTWTTVTTTNRRPTSLREALVSRSVNTNRPKHAEQPAKTAGHQVKERLNPPKYTARGKSMAASTRLRIAADWVPDEAVRLMTRGHMPNRRPAPMALMSKFKGSRRAKLCRECLDA